MPKVDVAVTVGGSSLPSSVRIQSLQLDMALDRHHVARIRLAAGDMADSGSERSSALDDVFDAIGKAASVQLKATGEDGSELKFDGVVMRAAHERASRGDHHVVLTVASPTVLLEAGPRCRVWEKKSTKDIAQSIVDAVGGLKSDVGSLSTAKIDYEAQYEESDWAFLRRLAARSGSWLYYDGEKALAAASFSGASTTISVGSDSPRFEEFVLEARVAPGAFRQASVIATSKARATHTDSDGSTDASNPFVKLARQRSTDIFTSPAHPVPLGEVFEAGDEKNQATSLVQSWIRSLVVGHGITTHPGLKAGSLVQVSGSGGKEDDSYIVLSASHNVSGEGYSCVLELIPAVAAFPAVEPGPRATGLQRAIVLDKYDPEFAGMVKVQYARAVDGDTAEGSSDGGEVITTWVRVAAPQAGESGGIVAIPEVGDEVVIGHVGGRATHPIVLGSVYTKDKKSEAFSEVDDLIQKNDGKAWRTKSGNLILINDADGKQTIQLRSPEGKNSVKLTLDGGTQIVIETEGDVHVRAKKDVSIQADGKMSFESKGDMKIDAKGKLEVTSTGKMSLESTQSFEAKGLDFKAQGQTSAELSGAKVDVKGSALTSVSGALVKIN